MNLSAKMYNIMLQSEKAKAYYAIYEEPKKDIEDDLKMTMRKNVG